MTSAVTAARTDAPASLPFLPRTRRGDRRRWHDGPTPVSLADLTAITRQVAAEVVAGHARGPRRPHPPLVAAPAQPTRTSTSG